MRLSLTDSERALRDEVRAFLAERCPAPEEIPEAFAERAEFLREWQRELHAAGLVALSWPEKYGGRGATLSEQIVVDQEMARAGAPELLGAIGLTVVAPTIIEHGTDAQRAAYLDRILSGDDVWCQGFSEPNAGSDLASLRTKAVDNGDHFVLTGQKTWTSVASIARYCVVLARTDPDAAPHRGISYLIVDLNWPGVEVRPMELTTGEAEFGEVFFEDVVVPRENLLGPLHGGWKLAMHTLGHERGPYAMARQVVLRVALDRAIEEARHVPRNGRPAIESPEIRQALARAHVELEVLKHQCYRSVGRLIAGGEPGAESSVDKIVLGRTEQLVAQTALDVLGPYAPLGDGSPWAANNALAHRFYLYGRAGSVYGGSAQIQRNIIAERLLGLPRSG
jgi:alkylation response protein AidB-like acyl-CoA dehydrogenase